MTFPQGGAIPLARRGDGRMVRPWEADREESYRCPGCGAAVVLRRGDRRRPHFAHRGASCQPDSALHRAAKARVVEVVTEWVAGRGPRPSISRPCPRPGCEGGVVQDLPDGVTHAASEARLDSGLIGDVVLFRGPEPAVVIEILVTSAVSAEKAARLGMPWVELSAADVLDRPYWWVAVQDGLRPFTCRACDEVRSNDDRTLRQIRERAEATAQGIGVALAPGGVYHPVAHTCWRCRSKMIVYAWPGGGNYSVTAPPNPVPASVQRRWTDGAGDYWANCCPRCSAVQGDYHLGEGNAEYARVREILEERYDAGGAG